MPGYEQKKKSSSFLTKVLLAFNMAVVIALFAGFFAAFLAPDIHWIFAFAGLAFPYAAILNLVFILIWMILGKKYLLISLIALLLCWTRLSGYIQFNGKKTTNTEEEGFKVLSYNVRIFDLYNWKKNKLTNNASQILNLLGSQQPDIVCLQEYHAGRKGMVDIQDSIKQYTGLKFHHIAYAKYKNKTKPYGIATFSRWPIIASETIKFENNTVNSCIYSDIVIKNDTVRVYNIHLESIQFSNEDYLYVSELTNQPDKQELNSENLFKIIRKLKKAFITRANQARTVAACIKKSPYKVVVCGDFNDTPSSYSYNQISSGLLDAFKQSGRGIGQTYAGTLPSFRIDYILHDMRFSSTEYARIRERWSDHYPVTARIFNLKED